MTDDEAKEHAVSDERDGASTDADPTDADPAGGGTAVATGGAIQPKRPSGKRSRQRAEVAEATADSRADAGDDGATGTKTSTAKTKTRVKIKTDRSGPSRNPFLFVYNYLKQVVNELRKVIWPNRKQMITYTAVVMAFLVFMVTLVSVSDYGLAKLVMLVFGQDS